MVLAESLLYQKQAIITFTVSLSLLIYFNSNILSAMIGHIRTNFKAMHDLFLVMKSRDIPTADEILMASGKKPFEDSIQAEYLKLIEEQASGIKDAFAKQQAKAAVRNLLN
jgi:hypothetical protein